ncbi:alpha/beta hydrolase [Candidatus Binatia bacterium]|nr:alpha/beta hydrolase [Candidatus Binatia bacterium]
MNFDFDKTTLDVDSKQVLDDTARTLRDTPDLGLQIEGYTDSTGDPAHNADLAKTRAKAVKRYLVEQGVEEDRLATKGLGEADPVASNESEETRAQNRRVELRVVEPFAVVRVFYGTDRRDEAKSEGVPIYGGDRGASEVQYGVADVSIPRDHQMGNIERPSIWRFEVRENPEKHVVILKVERENESAFFQGLSSRVANSQSKSAFVFVHGYNVSFPDALRRTAQLSYDLGFDGAPILYSWPSKGATLAYTWDENNIDWTVPHLRTFLEQVAKRSGASTVHLIAHSMGNRALTRAFAEIVRDRPPSERAMFKDLVLTAPDIDADLFRSQIVPAIVGKNTRVTLYASSRDKALFLSHGIHEYSRAGDAGTGIVVVDGMDTIDASAVDTDFLDHSYFGDSRSVITDLFGLITNQTEPAKRPGLMQVRRSDGLSYWAFRP